MRRPPEPEQPELDRADWLLGEPLAVWRRRYREAREAGLDQLAASMFADGHEDVGMLRRLAADGCSPDLIAANDSTSCSGTCPAFSYRSYVFDETFDWRATAS